MDAQLSPWWRRSFVILMVLGFSVLGFLARRTYRDAPPVPAKVIDETGQTLFTSEDITLGQQVFLRHGLMENGTIWGHGAYLGPDFSAEYLHTMALDVLSPLRAAQGAPAGSVTATATPMLHAKVARIIKQNRYDPATGTLTFYRRRSRLVSAAAGKVARVFRQSRAQWRPA